MVKVYDLEKNTELTSCMLSAGLSNNQLLYLGEGHMLAQATKVRIITR